MKREQYDALKKDFDAAKADYRIVEYPGAVHAFTNPEATELGTKFNLPLRYDAKADQEAKAEATSFRRRPRKSRQKGPPCGWPFRALASCVVPDLQDRVSPLNFGTQIVHQLLGGARQ
ncbi:dienelactone hydrolase family protein [Bradyrhizobium japonicum]